METSILYPHWKDVPWDYQRWPNFTPDEYNLSCPRTNEFYLDFNAFDCLQKARSILNTPIKINSGHRSSIHNALVGGKPLSSHLNVAFDISILNHDHHLDLYYACKEAGFTGFGFYFTFLHVDTNRPRSWSTSLGEKKWSGLQK